MVNPQNSPLYSLRKRQGKDKHFQTQYKEVYAALFMQPKTMLMVSIETGILRANICRHIATMRNKKNRITLVRKGYCQITKHRAGYYTTNPKLMKGGL